MLSLDWTCKKFYIFFPWKKETNYLNSKTNYLISCDDAAALYVIYVNVKKGHVKTVTHETSNQVTTR